MKKYMPIDATELDLSFGGDMKKLLPPTRSIPEDFFKMGCKWEKIISEWFYFGLKKGTEFKPKEDINIKNALRHIAAILSSFEPKHEHKIAGCAYLMSLWFDDVIFPK